MGTTWSTILLAASIRSLDHRREHLGENFQLRFQIRPGVSALWYTSSLSKRKLIKIPYLVLIYYDSSHDKANATDTRITAASGNFARAAHDRKRRAGGAATHGLSEGRNDRPRVPQYGVNAAAGTSWNHQAIERQLAHAERNAVSAA